MHVAHGDRETTEDGRVDNGLNNELETLLNVLLKSLGDSGELFLSKRSSRGNNSNGLLLLSGSSLLVDNGNIRESVPLVLSSDLLEEINSGGISLEVSSEVSNEGGTTLSSDEGVDKEGVELGDSADSDHELVHDTNGGVKITIGLLNSSDELLSSLDGVVLVLNSIKIRSTQCKNDGLISGENGSIRDRLGDNPKIFGDPSTQNFNPSKVIEFPHSIPISISKLDENSAVKGYCRHTSFLEEKNLTL